VVDLHSTHSEIRLPPDFAFLENESGLSIYKLTSKEKPLRLDFASERLNWRRKSGVGREDLLRAIGVKSEAPPSVLDLTAGLGRDAFLLADRGCRVVLVERSAVMAALLHDALVRGALHPDTQAACQRMVLMQKGAFEAMQAWSGEAPDVIYLDPMYPEHGTSALPHKEMRWLRELVGEDVDADGLLSPALLLARKRVVVKRPLKAPDLAGITPHHRHRGRAVRFDVYFPLVAA
jgi:16S rRNA (guanine1516-N2)-methyltransferase